MFPGDPWMNDTVVWEDLEDDFSGCTWTSTVFEFPTWTTSLEKTLSEQNVQDVLCLPTPLTPPKLVTSNTATVDYVNLGTSVPVEKDSSKVKLQSVKYPETTCVCCLCQAPDFVVLPVLSCNTLSNDSFEKDLLPVVTFNGTKLVDGYFEENCISSNNTKVESTFGKVRGNIRERFRIPKEDPKSDPSEAMRKFSTLENMLFKWAICGHYTQKFVSSVVSDHRMPRDSSGKICHYKCDISRDDEAPASVYE